MGQPKNTKLCQRYPEVKTGTEIKNWLEVKMGQPRDAKKGQGWPEVKTGQPSDINEGKERPEVKTGQPQVGKKVQR